MRERRVWRVVAAYVVAAIGLLEAADLSIDALNGPPVLLTWLFLLALCGFPVAVACAWVFDITPDGIKRSPEEDSASSRYRSSTAFIALLCVAIAISGVAGWTLATWRGGDEVGAIAVLPFTNLTGDPEQVYFVDGIHESLIAEMGRLSGVDVISRTSAVQYRDSERALRQIGSELDVDAVVEGSVLRAGNRLTLIVTLVEVQSERSLWSGQFERNTNNVETLQREVVLRIAREIELSSETCRRSAADKLRASRSEGTGRPPARSLSLARPNRR